jgi:hypothetical protein
LFKFIFLRWGVVAVIALITEAMVFAPAEISSTKRSIFAIFLVFLFLGLLIFSFVPLFITKVKPLLPRFLAKRFPVRSTRKSSSLSTMPSAPAPVSAVKDHDIAIVWNQNPLETTPAQIEMTRPAVGEK